MALSSADKLEILIALMLEDQTATVLLKHETVTELLEIPLFAGNEPWHKLIEAENEDDASRRARQANSVSGMNLLT